MGSEGQEKERQETRPWRKLKTMANWRNAFKSILNIMLVPTKYFHRPAFYLLARASWRPLKHH